MSLRHVDLHIGVVFRHVDLHAMIMSLATLNSPLTMCFATSISTLVMSFATSISALRSMNYVLRRVWREGTYHPWLAHCVGCFVERSVDVFLARMRGRLRAVGNG